MVDACNVANLYLHNFKQYSPLMGHVNQFNVDIDPIILLEITGTQALRDLMEASPAWWQPRLKNVAFSLAPVSNDDLDNAVANIKQRNSHYQSMQSKDGACLERNNDHWQMLAAPDIYQGQYCSGASSGA